MSTFERIQETLAQKKIALHALVISLNLPKQTAANWKGGKSRQYMKLLPEISKIIGVSVEDLQAAADDKERKAMTGTPSGRKARKSAARAKTAEKKAAATEPGEPNSTISVIVREMGVQKISVSAFCSDMGIKAQTFYNWKSGLSHSYMKMLPEISKYLGVCMEELTGELTDEKESEEKKSLLSEMDEIFSELSPDAQEVLISMAKMLKG